MLFKKKEKKALHYWRVVINAPSDDGEITRRFLSERFWDWHDASFLQSFLEKHRVKATIEMHKQE